MNDMKLGKQLVVTAAAWGIGVVGCGAAPAERADSSHEDLASCVPGTLWNGQADNSGDYYVPIDELGTPGEFAAQQTAGYTTYWGYADMDPATLALVQIVWVADAQNCSFLDLNQVCNKDGIEGQASGSSNTGGTRLVNLVMPSRGIPIPPQVPSVCVTQQDAASAACGSSAPICQ
jgi:hypothetical protein